MLFKIKRIEWCNFQVVGAQMDATTSKNAQIRFWDITPKHKSKYNLLLALTNAP
jgi:hypothetical protein